MTAGELPPEKPSFGRRLMQALTAFVRALVRLLIIVIVIGLIGAGVYWGVPAIYRSYIQPVQDNTARLDGLSTEIEINYELLTQQLDSLQTRVDTLEIQNDTGKQTISELADQLATAEASLENQAVTIQSLDGVQEDMATLVSAVASAEATLDELAATVDDNSDTFLTIGSQLGSHDDALVTIQGEIKILEAMQLLIRARIFYAENNFGLAQGDIIGAIDILSSLQETGGSLNNLSDVIQRLELANENIELNPEIAADDLEIAWELLLQSLSIEPSKPTEPLSTPDETPVPTEVTGTPPLPGTETAEPTSTLEPYP